MIHEYDDPNTCYAIGDCFSVLMGTAITNRQPSSGVFEEVSSIAKNGTTDDISLYDGSTAIEILDAGLRTGHTQADSSSPRQMPYNMAIKISNSVYLRKVGSTDQVVATGVQVDA